jgi:hypothetical protein
LRPFRFPSISPLKGNAGLLRNSETGSRCSLWKNASENEVDIALMALVVLLGMIMENSFECKRALVASDFRHLHKWPAIQQNFLSKFLGMIPFIRATWK